MHSAGPDEACCFQVLSERLAAINQHWKQRWRMENPGLLFRGIARAHHALDPSLLRPPYPRDDADLAGVENSLWAEFQLRSMPLLGRSVRTAWEATFIMQQHGLPTRLLDWSRSLAVAAHFAVRDLEVEEDGAVWIMAARHLMELRGGLGVWRTMVGDPSIEGLAVREDAAGLAEFNAQTPVPLSPHQVDPRMIAQQGMYTLHSFARGALEQLAKQDRATHGPACFLQKITIPADCKVAFRLELPVIAGVKEDTLFPDLGGFARGFAQEWWEISQGQRGAQGRTSAP